MSTEYDNFNTNWMSPKEVAYDLSISYNTVIRFIKTGNIKAYKIGRHYKINPEDVISFINNSATV